MRMIAMLTKCLEAEPRSQLSQERKKKQKIKKKKKKKLKTYKKKTQLKINTFHFSNFLLLLLFKI